MLLASEKEKKSLILTYSRRACKDFFEEIPLVASTQTRVLLLMASLLIGRDYEYDPHQQGHKVTLIGGLGCKSLLPARIVPRDFRIYFPSFISR